MNCLDRYRCGSRPEGRENELRSDEENKNASACAVVRRREHGKNPPPTLRVRGPYQEGDQRSAV